MNGKNIEEGNLEKKSSQNFQKLKEKKSIKDIQLSISYWFVTNRFLLKKILQWILIVFIGIFWLYSLIMWTDYLFLSGKKQRDQFANWASIDTDQEIKEQIKAENILLSDVNIFSSGVGLFDFVVKAENPNNDWLIALDYRFIGQNFKGESHHSFILPNDIKYLVDLGVKSAFRPVDLRIEIIDIKYMKVDRHKIQDYSSWSKERLNLIIENQKFTSTAVSKKKFVTLSFDVRNLTPYNYWNVGFYILLYRGNELIAVNYTTTEQLMSDENRMIQVQFYEGLPTINKVEILPEVEIFDPDVYMDI